MKNIYIIANWKANKNTQDATSWLEQIGSSWQSESKVVILCPAFPLLHVVRDFIEEENLPLQIGSQDISKFDSGPFTGEVSGQVLKDYVTYSIIGHSERREKLGESDEDAAQKVTQANKNGLKPVFCVQNAMTPIPYSIELVAYEPVFAIGTNSPDTPENAESIARQIKEKNPNVKYVIYGGSVTPENVHSFTSKDQIDGVLVGTKSLDPVTFSEIITNS